MSALMIDEALADHLDDGNARRGWWLDLHRQKAEAAPIPEVYDLGSGAAELIHAEDEDLPIL